MTRTFIIGQLSTSTYAAFILDTYVLFSILGTYVLVSMLGTYVLVYLLGT